MHRFVILVITSLFGTAILFAADEPKPIGPAEAAKQIDQTVVLRMVVKSSSISGNVGFLNSEASHRDEKNFVVFLSSKVLSQFRDGDIENPPAHFQGKTVEVKGKVTLHRGKPEIILDKASLIKIVAENENPPAKKPE
jgi:DNA/RNA endonuclease YhcR with UshA esterase domain